MSKWQHARLADVAYFQEGPGILARDFTEIGVPLVRLAGLGGYEATLKGCNHVDPSVAERKWAHFKLKPGDILVSTSASFGRPAIVGIEAEGAIFYTGIIRFRSKSSNLDDGYLELFLGSSAFMAQAEALASGSVIRHFGPSHLREMTIPLPPLGYQRAMAEVAAALADKIDLNRRMNETLEAMARALFKDWFVDFGPTRAKMEGREPYLAPDLWALFPDRLDDEGKPEGWEMFRLDHIAEHHKRTITPYSDPETVFEHFSLPAFDNGQNPALDAGEAIKSNKTVVPPRAVLLSKLNPEITRVWLTETAGRYPQIASTEFLTFIGRNGADRGLLFCLFSDVQFREMLLGMVTGTSKSHQRVSPPDLMRREVLVGHAVLFEHFAALVGPLLDRVLANRNESRTLAQTRDLLLPKLMSGEIRVRDAERMVEELV